MNNKKGNKTPTLEISKKNNSESTFYFITEMYDIKLISFHLSI